MGRRGKGVGAAAIGATVLLGGLALAGIDSARYRDNARAAVRADLDQHAAQLQNALTTRLQEARALSLVAAAELALDDDDLFHEAVVRLASEDEAVVGAAIVSRDGAARRFSLPGINPLVLALLDDDGELQELGESGRADGLRLYDPSAPGGGLSSNLLFRQILDSGEVGVFGPLPVPGFGDLLIAVQPATSLDDSPAPAELLTLLVRLDPIVTEAGISDLGIDLDHRDLAMALDGATVFNTASSNGDITVDESGSLVRPGLAVAHIGMVDEDGILQPHTETSPVLAPGVDWRLHGAPTDGWPLFSPAAPLIILPSFGVAYLAYLLARRRQTETDRLEAEVERATHRLAATMAHERAVFDNVPDGILDVTSDGLVQDTNPAAAHLLGVDRDTVVGHEVDALLPGFEIRGGRPPQAPVDVLMSDGRLLEVIGTAWSGAGPDSSGVTVAIRDVTEQRRVRDVLGRYTRKLEETAARLEEINRVRSDLVSKISHEIRTPMTTIRGFTELLDARGEDLTPEQRRNAMAALHRHGERLWDLISNLLELSESQEERPVEVTPVAVPDVVVSVAESLHATVEVTGSATAVVAVTDLQRALRSLLSNAVKYGAAPVEVHVAAKDVDVVQIDVVDHGPGVPPEFLDQLFEPFTQSSQGDRRTATGLGIGLPLVRSLMQRNNGDVELVSIADPTIFRLRLPRARVEVRDGAGAVPRT